MLFVCSLHNTPPEKTKTLYKHFSSIKKFREPGNWALKKLTWHLTQSFQFHLSARKWNDKMSVKPWNQKMENIFFSGNLSHSGKRNSPNNNNRTIKKAPSNHNFLLFKTMCFLPSETKFIFSQLRAKSQIFFYKKCWKKMSSIPLFLEWKL